MGIGYVPTLAPIDFWHALEGYTPTINIVGDNDANYVTVANINGRGILVQIGASVSTTAGIIVRITRDGGGATIYTFGAAADEQRPEPVLFLGFSTSILVEMRGNAAVNCNFYAVSLVE